MTGGPRRPRAGEAGRPRAHEHQGGRAGRRLLGDRGVRHGRGRTWAAPPSSPTALAVYTSIWMIPRVHGGSGGAEWHGWLAIWRCHLKCWPNELGGQPNSVWLGCPGEGATVNCNWGCKPLPKSCAQPCDCNGTRGRGRCSRLNLPLCDPSLVLGWHGEPFHAWTRSPRGD